jgi:hypothetical protein
MINYTIKNNILDDIMSIHTDCLILKKEKTFHLTPNKNVPKPEGKPTAMITFYHYPKCRHIYDHCGEEFKYKELCKQKNN